MQEFKYIILIKKIINHLYKSTEVIRYAYDITNKVFK